MATIDSPDHHDFWSLGEVDCFVGAPMRLHNFMSRKCFKVILKALAITARQPPAFRDHFWEVREVLEAWNSNMTEQFTPSWVSCLDESMSTWTNKYSCPGWMFVPKNCGPLAMSTTQCVAHCQGFCGRWSLWKERILHPQIQQSGENSWIVASCLGAHIWKGHGGYSQQWILCVEGDC